jgi:hypothetical protein
MAREKEFEVQSEWVAISRSERTGAQETYGYVEEIAFFSMA